jgi:hypothetical protein
VTIPLPARAWFALLANDIVAFALLITGIATGVSLVVAAVPLRTRACR